MSRAMLIAISIALFGFSCEEAPSIDDYVCTAEEHSRVEQETDYCSENTGYLASYCYSSALKRVCHYRRAAAAMADAEEGE